VALTLHKATRYNIVFACLIGKMPQTSIA
jgi:hypothetical protein